MQTPAKQAPKTDKEFSPEKDQADLNAATATLAPDSKNKLFLGILLGVGTSLLIVAVVVAIMFFNKSFTLAPGERPESIPQATDEGTISTNQPSPTPQSGIKWLAQPQKVAALKLFQPYVSPEDDEMAYQMFDVEQAEFYKVADMPDGGQLFSAYIPVNAPSDPVLFRIYQTVEGQYSVLSKYLTDWDVEEVTKQLLPEVQWTDMAIKELDLPEEITVDNFTLETQHYVGKLFSELTKPQIVTQSTPYGDLYLTYEPILDSKEIFARVTYLKLVDGTVAPYSIKHQVLNDDLSPSWQTDAEQYTQSFLSTCGNDVFNSVPVIKNDSLLIANKKLVGTTKAGDSVYMVTDANGELVKKLYDLYDSSRTYEDGAKVLSLEQFAQKDTHIIWQDPLGDWQIFANIDYAIIAECGKPVIYLYPEETTQVSVQVGADFSYTEPVYPNGGWQVTAKPNGQLSYQGQTYPYLFWEGTGHGYYPNYQDRGVVVKADQVVATVQEQLKAFGLNQQEITDFLEFWQARFPKENYVRLTWLGTREMDVLAPLQVSPAPDSKIRVFLEFEPLASYKALQPQKIYATPRTGFTLVEWGGLLVGKQ